MKNKYWGNKYKNNLEVGITPTEPGHTQQTSDVGPMMPQVVEVVENRIYFYADIDRENILKLNKTLDTLNSDLLHKAKVQNHTAPNIYLFINSFGGHVFDAFSGLDAIRSSPISVYTVIDGCTASAATFMSIAGTKRFIKPHAYVLIHQISSMMWGKYAEFKDEMKNLDKFMVMIKKLYKENTKLPMKKLEEILEHDLWFDAEEAISYGLADEVFK